MAVPSDYDRVNAALKSASTSAPAGPKIVDTRLELGMDEAGDAAAFITVVLDESTRGDEWTSANLRPIADHIKNSLRDSGIGYWPYVRFAKPSDLNSRAAG